ncbi:hypothetical protein H633G_11509 [Metarhizium anisopliae BRIP 53284]|nr:hypothetical protein H633G_11509 [Metarhizium anisopliae BRIP 53284]
MTPVQDVKTPYCLFNMEFSTRAPSSLSVIALLHLYTSTPQQTTEKISSRDNPFTQEKCFLVNAR